MIINLVTSTKGGSGKSLLSLTLHRALFNVSQKRARNTLVMDLSQDNEDVACLLSKFVQQQGDEVGRPQQRKYKVDNLPAGCKLATAQEYTSPLQLLIETAQLGEALQAEEVIVDTTYDTFLPLFEHRQGQQLRQQLSKIIGDDIEFRIWHIWRPGTVLRVYDVDGEKKWEAEETIRAVNFLRHKLPNIQVVNVVNPQVWAYGTRKYQRKIIKILEQHRNNTVIQPFEHVVKQFIYRPSVYMSKMFSAMQGINSDFHLTEILFLASVLIHVVGTKQAKQLFNNPPSQVKELYNYETVEPHTMPANLAVYPPPKGRIGDLSMFMFSSHLLRPYILQQVLGDDEALGLPYKLLRRQGKKFAWHIKALDRFSQEKG